MGDIVYDERMGERLVDTVNAFELKIRRAIRHGVSKEEIDAMVEHHIARLGICRNDNAVRAVIKEWVDDIYQIPSKKEA